MTTCLHLNHRPALAGASNSVGMWCFDCEEWVTKTLRYAAVPWLPRGHRLLIGVDRSALPRVNAEKVACEICEVETKTPELHHWCPRAIYRDNPPPNEGPQAWLCKACHATWHQMVTPGLLPLDAHTLLRSLWKRMQHDRGQWDAFVQSVIDANAAVQRKYPPQRQDVAA